MVYSLETCTFLSPYENSMLVDHDFKKKKIIAISPKGERIEVFGVKQWCRENGFHYNSVRKVLNGTWKHTKGWKFERIPEENK